MFPKMTSTIRARDWIEAIRNVTTAFNAHYHEPFAKTGSVSTNTTLDDDNHFVTCSVSGLTITLPACTSARVGTQWTVHLGTTGNVTIVPSGSDVIITDYSATDTSVQIITRGDSLTFHCTSTSTWSIV